LDQPQIDRLVQAITEEILGYLGTAGPRGETGLEIEDEICPGCDGRCAERCPRKTRRIVEAGAARISATSDISQIEAEIAALIDHTQLGPNATREQIQKLCQEAVRFGFASVVINPWYVPLAAEMVRGSSVKVSSVVGFPFGATVPQVKIFETEEVVKLGAQEVDMVINIGALKSGQHEVVESDIRGVVQAAREADAIVKVILETAFLTQEEKVRGSLAAKSAGAEFVKTSTGFGPGGATAEDVALMRAAVGEEIGVKAAGGVRTLEDLKRMVAAGATRIGASASVRILEQAREAPR